MTTVASSIEPARRPISAIAGATKPTMRSGMMNPKKELKRELKVAKHRAAHSGRTKPAPMPRAIAAAIRGRRPMWRSLVMVFGRCCGNEPSAGFPQGVDRYKY